MGYVIWHYRANKFKNAKLTLSKYLKENRGDWYGYYLLGKLSLQMKNYDSALSSFDMAIQLMGQSDPYEKLPILHDFGLYYQEIGKVDSAEFYYNKANMLAQKLGAKGEQIRTYQACSNIWKKEGSYRKIADSSWAAIKIAQELEEYSALSNLYFNLAFVYGIMGDRDRAQSYYLLTIQEAKKIQNAELISQAYIELGRQYMKLELWEKALEYFNSSKRVAKEASVDKSEHLALLNIGDIYKFQMDIEHAKQSYEAVLRYARRTKQYTLTERCLIKLANLYLEPNSHLNKAQYYLALADAFARQTFQIQLTANHRWMQGLISLFEHHIINN